MTAAMNQTERTDEQEEKHKHEVACSICSAAIEGPAKKTKAAARVHARRQAYEAGWVLHRRHIWHCPACEDHIVQTSITTRRAAVHARRQESAKRHIDRERSLKQAKKANEAKRRTKAVGKKIADADHDRGITKDTQKLVYRNEFDRLVYHRLQPREKNAADAFEQLYEKAGGVSDKEPTMDRVDSSVRNYEPPIPVIDALRELTMLQKEIGARQYQVIELAIVGDKKPGDIGKLYQPQETERRRRQWGMFAIKWALDHAADFFKIP